MNRPPIVLIVYNRPSHTERTIKSLANNIGAKDSNLYVFSDGPITKADENKVADVRSIIKSYSNRFKKLNLIERDTNYGLAKSVILGVTEIVSKYGCVIVLEDDLVSSKETLNYFDTCLNYYKDYDSVFSISAYTHPIDHFQVPDGYQYDIFFVRRMMCWGWATWKDRWQRADWKVDDFDEFIKSEHLLSDYRRLIGADSLETLKQCVAGTKDVWACRWVYAHYKNNALCGCPTKSYIENIGLDGSGSNCGILNHINNELNIKKTEALKLPEKATVDEELSDSFLSVYRSSKVVNNAIKKFKIKKIKKLYKSISISKIIAKVFDIFMAKKEYQLLYLGTEYGGWNIIPEYISKGDYVLSAGVGRRYFI